jgi:predicted N-acetyltransferase YhbS
MKIGITPEYALKTSERELIYALRKSAFPEHDVTNHYGKQLPTARVLAWDEHRLVGHVALIMRMIRLNDKVYRAMGIQDVIVEAAHRGRGIMTRMLQKAEAMAVESDCSLLILFAEEPEIYEHLDFVRVVVDTEWLKIHEGRHLGIGREKVEETMIKWLHPNEEAIEFIDMLGHIF